MKTTEEMFLELDTGVEKAIAKYAAQERLDTRISYIITGIMVVTLVLLIGGML
jgi:hypothetical protein